MTNLKNISENLRKHSTKISIVLILVITTIIIYYRVIIQMEIGPMWDTYDFLSNALLFAGKDMGYSDLTRPLILPFLTSIFFRLGYISEATIFAVDGIFLVLGALGLYLFFKLRFNNLESILGSLLFSTFPIVILFSGIGFSDIPSVSLSIWAFYFTVLAVKKNSKYFYLAFPLAMLAFLTRYTAGLILFPMLLYIVINQNALKNLKNIIIGISISSLVLIPVFIFFYNTFGNPFFSFQSFIGGAENPGAAGNYYYQPDLFYYLNHLISYIGPAGIAIIFIILFGIMIYGFSNLNKIKSSYKNTLFKFNVDKRTKLGVLAFSILVLIFYFTFFKIAFIEREIILLLLFMTSYKVMERLKIRCLDMNFLFLSWFMAFFIFHSAFAIKDDRYFVTMAPATAYFFILGFSTISSRLDFKFKNRNLLPTLLSLILIMIMLVSAINYIPGIVSQNELTREKAEVTHLASDWLKNYDHDYKNKVIYADYWAYFSWYLKTDVKPMPVFKDGKAYTYQLKDYKIDKLSNTAYNNKLNQNNVTYYFSNREGLNLTHYRPIKQFGFVTIYQRIS